MTGEVTAAIADFTATARYADIPAAVIDRAKIHILDTLGLALAGSVSDAARLACAHIDDLGAVGACSVFGTKHRLPPRFAAFVNAAAAHADNFDDTTPQVRADRTGGIHASAAMLPVVLALGETATVNGRDMLAAYLVGVETASRLNHAIGARHYADGFHTTGTLNVFGAACAAARLLGLERDRVVCAIGIAASRAAGVRRNFGSMTEILHTAHAAEDGLIAADLAARGLTAAPDALDGPTGFFAAAAGDFDTGEIVGKLGAPWVFDDPGVWIKPHPNGALTHPGAGCLLGILQKNDIASGDIARIDVRTNERVWKTLQHHDPADGMQAKFSMEFTLAVIAVHRRAGLADFTTEMLRAPDIRDMMKHITYVPYDAVAADFTNVTTLVEVATSDGRVLTGRADHARGSTPAPMDFGAVADKFRQCAAFGGMKGDRVEQIAGLVSGFETLDGAAALTNLLSE